MPFPTCGYKRRTVSFSPSVDFISYIPGVENYDPENSKKYIVKEILTNKTEDSFIKNRTLQNLINNLISTGFINTLKQLDAVTYC